MAAAAADHADNPLLGKYTVSDQHHQGLPARGSRSSALCRCSDAISLLVSDVQFDRLMELSPL
jgi:hypothetical protein